MQKLKIGCLQPIKRQLASVPARVWSIYFVIYLTTGTLLQGTASLHQIAKFARDWQVLTIYGCYLIPLSILVRNRIWYEQYAYSLVAIAPLELIGYSMQTSVAFPNNIFDVIFGIRNFTLAFALLAAWIPYCGNMFVLRLDRIVLGVLQRWKKSSAINVRQPLQL